MKKVNGGNFYLDDNTVKMGKDKILYVAKDLQGNLTDVEVKNMLGDYALAKDGVHTGTTQMQSVVVEEELTALTINAPTIKQGDMNIAEAIQDIKAEIRELQPSDADVYLVHFYNVYSGTGDVIGMQSPKSANEIISLVKKNKLMIANNSDNHTITPMFVYDYDDNGNLYWYQQDVIDGKILKYKQTDTDVVEYEST